MTDLVLRSSEVPANFREQMFMAQTLAESTLLPGHLRGKPANVLVILQGARALDVSAFWALQSMHVIEGKLGMSAELMRGLAVRAGHKVRVVERTAEKAIIEILRKDRDTPYRAEFTWQDALDAKLQDKDNWKKYRKSMLVARATSIAMRDECPDVLFGVVYTPDELGAVTDADENPIFDDKGKPVIDGEVVQVTPEQVRQFALEITLATVDRLPALWNEVVALGVAYEKVPAEEGRRQDDDSLWDVLTKRVAALIQADTVTEEDLRGLWTWGAPLKVLEARVAVAPDGMDKAWWKVGDLIKMRKQELDLEAVRRANAAAEAAQETQTITDKTPEAGGEVSEAEAVAEVAKAFDIKPEDITTEHAEELRRKATDSWGELG